jgi:poly(hydroxyalkanoate) granule-associated protein
MLKKAKAQAKSQLEDIEGLSQGVLESSRQIWLAGLGAFSRAQAEGMKMFETLVDQGRTLESRTRRAATETAAAAAGAAAQKAKEVHAMAGGTWDKLEQVFEDRVARALSKLGVHTQNDVAQLAERVDALSEAVNALLKAEGRAPAAARAAKRGTKPPAKKRQARARKAPAAAAPAPAAPAPAKPARPRKTAKRVKEA